MGNSMAADTKMDATAQAAVSDRSRAFEITVNGQKHKLENPILTRREVILLAKFDPDQEVCVRVNVQGTKPRVVLPHEDIDLTLPGIEDFLVGEKCVRKVEVNGIPMHLAVPTNGKGVKEAAIKAGVRY